MKTRENTLAEPLFVISRVLEAPRELVWESFADPRRLGKWWGPKGFTVKNAKMDFSPGGSYHYCLRSPEGKDMWGLFVYHEMRPLERIVFVNCFSNEKGDVARHPMNPNWPLETLTTIIFNENRGGTALTIHWTPVLPTELERVTFESGMASMNQGWTGTLDQLSSYLRRTIKGQ